MKAQLVFVCAVSCATATATAVPLPSPGLRSWLGLQHWYSLDEMKLLREHIVNDFPKDYDPSGDCPKHLEAEDLKLKSARGTSSSGSFTDGQISKINQITFVYYIKEPRCGRIKIETEFHHGDTRLTTPKYISGPGDHVPVDLKPIKLESVEHDAAPALSAARKEHPKKAFSGFSEVVLAHPKDKDQPVYAFTPLIGSRENPETVIGANSLKRIK